MNSEFLLDALEYIDERYILKAQRRLGLLAGQNKARPRPVRRIFTVALAAALALICTLAAAMAVSPQFREAVISLFQLGEVERVPDVPETGYEVKQVTIGGQVSAQYVRTDGYWLANDGETILRQWDDGEDRFWDLMDGQLAEVGTDARETTAHVSWQGIDYTIRFRTFVHDGLLYTCDVTGNESSHSSDVIWPERLGRRTDVVQLNGWSVRDSGESNWCWVCDLKTGQVWDVLAGCGLEKFPYLNQVLLAEDGKHALIRAWDGGDGSGQIPYLVDLEEKTYAPLGELMGLDIKADTRSYDYEVSFAGSDRVLLSMPPVWSAEPANVWTYHIPSGTVTPILTNEEGFENICTDLSGYTELAAKVNEDGSLTIIDLGDGRRVRLEGVTFSPGHQLLKANAARTKLLWMESGEGAQQRMGVIDLETGEFTAFAREGLDPRLNETFSWLGNDRVVTTINLHTGEGYVPGGEEYYLCVYEF